MTGVGDRAPERRRALCSAAPAVRGGRGSSRQGRSEGQRGAPLTRARDFGDLLHKGEVQVVGAAWQKRGGGRRRATAGRRRRACRQARRARRRCRARQAGGGTPELRRGRCELFKRRRGRSLTDGQVDHIHLGGHRVIEGIEEPGGVGHLRASEMKTERSAAQHSSTALPASSAGVPGAPAAAAPRRGRRAAPSGALPPRSQPASALAAHLVVCEDAERVEGDVRRQARAHGVCKQAP